MTKIKMLNIVKSYIMQCCIVLNGKCVKKVTMLPPCTKRPGLRLESELDLAVSLFIIAQIM